MGAVLYKRAGVYWSKVHPPSRKSQKRHVQRKETREATDNTREKKAQPGEREKGRMDQKMNKNNKRQET